MKKENLEDAIGGVGDDIIVETYNVKKKGSRKQRFVPLIAAALAVSILIVSLSVVAHIVGNKPIKGSNTGLPRKYVLCEAVYPEAVKFPNSSLDYRSDEYMMQVAAWAQEKQEKTEKYNALGVDLNNFATKTAVKFLFDDENGNVNTVYSPTLLYVSLAALAEFTQDSSKREDLFALLEVDSIEQLRERVSLLWKGVYENDGAATCIMANSFWVEDNFDVDRSILEQIAANYFASVYTGKLSQGELNEHARKWIESQTGGFLKSFTGDFEFDLNTVFAMVSTVYFKNAWKDKFDMTKKEVFYSESGEKKTFFMKNKINTDYYYHEDYSAVCVPFEESGNAYFILPDEDKSVYDVISNGAIDQILYSGETNLGEHKVTLWVPKFDVSCSLNMKKGLSELGVGSIFKSVDDHRGVSKIEQNFRLKIDSQGCEGAAYSIVLDVWEDSPPQPDKSVTVTFDRPFIFIVTTTIGEPVFIGVVNDPTV